MYICVMPTGFGNNRYMTYDFRFKVSRPNRHKIRNFGDVIPSQISWLVLKANIHPEHKNTTTQKN